MSTKTEAGKSSFADTFVLLVSALVVVAGIYGFYYFEEAVIAPVRALGLVAVVGLAIFLMALTAKGKTLIDFIKDADIERRKVVWPTRQETIQTTIIVFVVVIIVGIMLFLIDMFFGWGIRALIGGG